MGPFRNPSTDVACFEVPIIDYWPVGMITLIEDIAPFPPSDHNAISCRAPTARNVIAWANGPGYGPINIIER